MKNMYSIAIPIAPVNKPKFETYSNVEANTYDLETTHFETKSRPYDVAHTTNSPFASNPKLSRSQQNWVIQ